MRSKKVPDKGQRTESGLLEAEYKVVFNTVLFVFNSILNVLIFHVFNRLM